MDLTLITGRFGSGKTEVAINYAVEMARGVGTLQGSTAAVLLVDLDIVTPYFRSREMAEAMEEQGVQVVTPGAVSRHLDLPAISPQILGAIEQEERPAVVDVGGDPQGARALGQFSAAISRRPYTMYFVVNPYRPFTDTTARLALSIAEVEGTSRLKVSSLISNPNLIGDTTPESILDGHARVEAMARELGLTVSRVCLERRWLVELGPERFEQPVLAIDRYFRMAWE